MHGKPRRPSCTRARLLVLWLLSLLLGATATPARRRLAQATDVVLSVPRGRAPYISTAPTKFVQAEFGQPLSSQTRPLDLFEISGAKRQGMLATPTTPTARRSLQHRAVAPDADPGLTVFPAPRQRECGAGHAARLAVHRCCDPQPPPCERHHHHGAGQCSRCLLLEAWLSTFNRGARAAAAQLALHGTWSCPVSLRQLNRVVLHSKTCFRAGPVLS